MGSITSFLSVNYNGVSFVKASLPNIFILLLSGILMFSSCSYELPDDFFVEKTPPGPYVEIELDIMNPGDTMTVKEISYFNYDMDLKGKKFLGGNIRYQAKSLPMNSKKGIFVINPVAHTFGFETLFMTFYFTSGTGSIADELQLEVYQANLYWIIHLTDGKPPVIEQPVQIPLSYHFGSEKELIVSWNSSTQPHFDRYMLRRTHGNDTTEIVISDRNTTSYIDNCYYGRWVKYELVTYVKGLSNSSRASIIIVQDPNPTFTGHEISETETKLSWNHFGYEAKYSLFGGSYFSPVYYSKESTDTFAIVPRIPLGANKTFWLKIEPTAPEGCVSPVINDLVVTYNYSPGIKVGGIGSHFVYNPIDNVIYMRDHTLLKAFNAETMELINSKNFNQTPMGSIISTGVNSKRIAILENATTLQILDGPDFLPIKTISFQSGAMSSVFTVTDSHVVYWQSNQFIVHNYLTDNKVFFLNVKEASWDFRVSASFSISENLLHVCRVMDNSILIRTRKSIDDDEAFSDVYFDSNRTYLSACFHPAKPEILYVSFMGESIIEERSIPDYNLLRTIQLKEPVQLKNIDLVGEKIMVTSPDELSIIDIDTGIVIYREENVNLSPRFFNNKWIFLDHGHYVDRSALFSN